MPDHSMIVTHFNVDLIEDVVFTQKDNYEGRSELNCTGVRLKKNIKRMDSSFFLDDKTKKLVNDTIEKIEGSIITQNTLDSIYMEIRNMFEAELSKLPPLPV